MLDLNKNPDFATLDNALITSEYYDIDKELDGTQVWNKDALDQMIEMVLLTEPQERLFNLSFGSPIYRILFENFNQVDTLMGTVFDIIEHWVPIKISRGQAEIEQDPDNNALIFKIPYVSNNGLVSGYFARKVLR